MKLKLLLTVLALSLFSFMGCEKAPEVVNDAFDVRLEIPATAEIPENSRILTLNVIGGKAPAAGDQFILQSTDGRLWPCHIVELSSTSISVELNPNIVQGSYMVYVKRGNKKKQMSYKSLLIKFYEHIDFTPDEGTTVYGKVSCDGEPLSGVVVSDGVEVTVTDKNGIYQIKSRKARGYVFVSVPSGYEPECKGIVPQFYTLLKEKAGALERADFRFKDAGDQTSYKLLVLGDMHLANRTGDLAQFRDFADDMNDYINHHKSEKIYALTLGDMTWDLYWYTDQFSFAEYIDLMNSYFKDLCVYHTMGNHDNDYLGLDDFTAEDPYIHNVAPNYYSFNIGDVHYVVLDNIDCSNYDGTTSRDYFVSITDGQLEWLAKDLEHVSKDTPIILTTHAPVTRPLYNGTFGYNYDRAYQLFNVLDGYNVDIITGHTHKVYNINEEEIRSFTGKDGFYEHNAGAICATWWWSSYMTPGIHISVDGSHGGYAIWDITGKEFEWTYKATGKSESHQFHSYDLNEVKKTITMPLGYNKERFSKFVENVQEYPADAVLLNVWNYNPSWTISVKENGKPLQVTQRFDYDPLHILALTAKRFQTNDNPYFQTNWSDHFFIVGTSSADSDLEIEVSDEFGHKYTETMKRPKPFTVDTYRNQN